MHEGAVMQTIVETVLASLKEVGASRVAGVSLELGSSGHFSEEAVRQYFQALTRDTPAHGAVLTLSWLPATYQCLHCQQRFESIVTTSLCPVCGGIALEVAHRDECSIRTIEMLKEDEHGTALGDDRR